MEMLLLRANHLARTCFTGLCITYHKTVGSGTTVQLTVHITAALCLWAPPVCLLLQTSAEPLPRLHAHRNVGFPSTARQLFHCWTAYRSMSTACCMCALSASRNWRSASCISLICGRGTGNEGERRGKNNGE